MSQADKTLIILAPGFPNNEDDTSWTPFVQLMVKALKRNSPGLNIVVLSFFYPGLVSQYTWHGIKVISFNGMEKGKWRRIWLWRKIWKELKIIQRSHSVMGIFSIWCGECAFIGKYFGRRHSIPHYTWICGQDARKTNKWVSFIQPRANQLVAMSPFLVNEFYKNHRVKPAHIIPNAVDPETFPPAMSIRKDIDIFGAGGLVPLKQYDIFTRVVGSLQELMPGIIAFHCGTGAEREKIETLIQQFGLGKNLALLGEKKHEEVLRLMQRTKLFLHTANYEGFGGVCIEALYAGAHVISFCYPLDHPVPHWHVVNNEEEMKAKAIEILQNDNTEYSSVLVYKMDDSARSVMNLFEKDSAGKTR